MSNARPVAALSAHKAKPNPLCNHPHPRSSSAHPELTPPRMDVKVDQELPQLPIELQLQIFDYAARGDSKCAFSLVQVARHINHSVGPVLYERIVLRDAVAASNLYRTLIAYPQGHFGRYTQSIWLGADVPDDLAKAVLEKLSEKIDAYTVFRNTQWSMNNHLDNIRSATLRRIVLLYSTSDPTIATRASIIEPVMFTSVTHFALITNMTYGDCSLAACVDEAFRITRSNVMSSSKLSSISPFQNLRCFATSIQRMGQNTAILKLAPQLQCFAILGFDEHRRQTYAGAFKIEKRDYIVAGVRRYADPRICLVRGYGEPCEFNISDGFHQHTFWDKVEDLARGRFICDDGEKWEERVVKDFLSRHPHVTLLEPGSTRRISISKDAVNTNAVNVK